MQESRPVFLNLFKIKLPIPGVASILHRVSGVLLFLGTPLSLLLLELSLQDEAGFQSVRELLKNPALFPVLFALLWSVSHHLLAGIRYLLLDFEIGIDKDPSARTAWGVLLGGAVLALILTLGVYL